MQKVNEIENKYQNIKGLSHESNLTYAQPLIFIMRIKESFL